MSQVSPNDTPISEPNLLWQNWQEDKTIREESFWTEETQQKDKTI